MSVSRAWELSGAKAAVGRATVLADGGYRGTGLLIPHRRERGRTGVHTAMLGIARLHNLTLTG